MGKHRINILLIVTLLFTAFLAGFYTGRNYNHAQIQIANPSSLTQVAAYEPRVETSPSEVTELTPTETEKQIDTETQTPVPESTALPDVDIPPASETVSSPDAEETRVPTEYQPGQTEPVATEVPIETKPTQTDPPPSGSGLINVNTASASLLETLPGIGEVIAQRIVDYRNTYGPFKTVYELINVKGIGEKRLAAIIHLVTV